ncbi:hypothetical protein HPB52_021213 [Rhipicephalus sanguineus]|uniref:Uncharacterized protein n=1 Tax=Rhipicephalus sanguineus TaxID=34632 RepID=A0A9D4Q5F6_RHISA|nr:hypothetical protein HPB52_021213 [Rhipicephalus sanguineus]
MSNRQVNHCALTIKEKLDTVNAIQHGAKKSVLAREKDLPLSKVRCTWTAREKVLNGAPSNLKRCRLKGFKLPGRRGSFIVLAQQTSPSEADAIEEGIDDSDCEALTAEVLERQGGGDRVPFATFCDVDKDLKTCKGLSDSDIIKSACGKLPSARDGEEDNDDDNNVLSWRMCSVPQ